MNEYLCDFEGDGKPGACQRPADWKVGKWDLCRFHANFMYSVDYQNELPKPKRRRRSEGKSEGGEKQ